jgi:short-subunit dehydrogenase
VTEYDDTYVLLAARDAGRGQAAIDDICREVAGTSGAMTTIKDRLELLVMDTSSTESVQRAAASLPADTKLYGIINNAGVRTFISTHLPR